MRASGIIFDLDGVLLDTVPAHYEAWQQSFAAYGYSFDLVAYRQLVDGKLARDGARAVMPTATEKDIDDVVEMKERLYRASVEAGRFEVFPDARDVVKRLGGQGVPMAVASSSSLASHVLGLTDLAAQFVVVVGGNDVAQGKPAPDAFLLAARHLMLSPDACLVIEDSVSGLAAARAGGFTAIGLRRSPDAGHFVDADQVIASLTEIASLPWHNRRL